MPSFDWQVWEDHDRWDLRYREQRWWGWEHWEVFAGLPNEFPTVDELHDLVEALAEERLSVSLPPPAAALAPAGRWFVCPRVFISHRRVDVAPARRIAELATRNGFQFWLDIYDPSLRYLEASGALISDEQRALLTAAIIEMGLLNSSHVLAVVTSAAQGSAWIPYEYGRVKLPGVFSPQAGCWMQRSYLEQLAAEGRNVPEYLLLGQILSDDHDVERWFQRESFGGCLGTTDVEWIGPTTEPLPG